MKYRYYMVDPGGRKELMNFAGKTAFAKPLALDWVQRNFVAYVRAAQAQIGRPDEVTKWKLVVTQENSIPFRVAREAMRKSDASIQRLLQREAGAR